MRVALGTVLAPLAFWTAVAVGSVLRPGYDQTASTISRLSVGANAAIVDAAFIGYGAATIAIALALRPRVAGLGRASLLLLAASGACTAGLGVQWVAWTLAGGMPVPAARPGLTADPLYDLIHDTLAAGTFTLSGLGSLLVGLGVRGRPGWRGYDLVFILVAAVVLVLTTYLGLRLTAAQGLVQRIAVLGLQLWVAVLAFRLHVLQAEPPAAGASASQPVPLSQP